MSTCPERDVLIEIDLVDLGRALEEEETGSLASHLAQCTSCQDAAKRLLAANMALDRALSAIPPIDPGAIIARARLDVPTAARRRRISGGVSALAAAAALAAVFLLGGRERPLPGTAFTAVAEAPAEIDVEGDADLAVIQTDDPDITVVWFFSGE